MSYVYELLILDIINKLINYGLKYSEMWAEYHQKNAYVAAVAAT